MAKRSAGWYCGDWETGVSKYWLQDASFICTFDWLEAVEVGLGSAFGAVYYSEDVEEFKIRVGVC